MSPDGSITAHRLWKRFRADRRRPVLRDEVERLRRRLRGEGGANWQWALRNLEFAVAPGEAVGLFGTNGSGKSTLLKILTRVMYPTAGRLDIAGRVGALIEIRAGIHPDLTGRENIYLYGSLMGLSRAGVTRRFDDIVEFAELQQAIDRQLKFYSSGMAMRLGFGVAAFLQPDILLVDEVLAVGDAAFQQRCLDRMRAVLNEGTTLMFVSHDLASIESIAKRGIWLHNGEILCDDRIGVAIDAYRKHIERVSEIDLSDSAVRVRAEIAGRDGGTPRTVAPLMCHLRVTSAASTSGVLHVGVTQGSAAPVFTLRTAVDLPAGDSFLDCHIEDLPLPRGKYYLWAAVTGPSGADLCPWHSVASFDVLGPDLEAPLTGVMRLSPVYVSARWSPVRGRSIVPSGSDAVAPVGSVADPHLLAPAPRTSQAP